jgi:tetratricopeptide (TPR) repeat protein
MSVIKLISDAEVKEAIDDSLGFKKYENILTGIAKGTTGPFTVGVYGQWGTGKTSLLRLVEKELEKDDDIVTVWFNAWQYEKEERIVFSLLASIIEKLDADKEIYGTVSNSLKGIAYGTIFDFGVIKFDGKKMIDREAVLDEGNIAPLLKKHTEYKTAFENLNLPDKKKVVVLIDDLDRCNPESAVKILESIKLLLNQEGFIFFLGLSEKVLDGYLKKIYQERYSVDLGDQDYLDKIIQLPFIIPPHERRSTDFFTRILKGYSVLVDIFREVDESASTEVEEILKENADLEEFFSKIESGSEEMQSVIMKSSDYNPRRIKRILNNIIVDHALINAMDSDPKAPKLSYVFVWRILQYSYGRLHAVLSKRENVDFLRSGLNNKIKGDAKNKKGEIVDDPDMREILAEISKPGFLELFEGKIGKLWLENAMEREAAYHFYRTQKGGTGSGGGGASEKLMESIETEFIEPKDAKTYFNRGNFRYELNHFEDAIADYDEVIHLDPKKVDAYINRGVAKSKLERYQDAIDDYDEAIHLDPKEVNAYINRGVTKGKLERHQDAIDDYDEAIHLDPKKVDAYINRGVAKSKLERYQDAIDDYDEAIHLDPKKVEAYYNRGVAKSKLERHQDAIDDYDKAIHLDPENANSAGNLARLLFAIDRKKEAENYWNLAFKNHDPKSELPLLLELYFYHYAHGATREVRQDAKKQVEKLLGEGVTSPGFDLTANVEKARKDNHEEIEEVERLAKAISRD